MKRTIVKTSLIAVSAVLAGFLAIRPGSVRGHCDTLGGPVLKDGRIALEKGDVTPVLKWIKNGHEAELRSAFAKALAVRGRGPEARELADRYFLETLVRLHRAGENAPYTGLKDEHSDTDSGNFQPLVHFDDPPPAAGLFPESSDSQGIKAFCCSSTM